MKKVYYKKYKGYVGKNNNQKDKNLLNQCFIEIEDQNETFSSKISNKKNSSNKKIRKNEAKNKSLIFKNEENGKKTHNERNK